jgi:ubiquinone/menaquinone biosynthesis C-methylase UbiE
VEDKVTFMEMDYHNLSFPDETFDVVWMLESFCYGQPKSKVIQEAFRVLKKGGRLIIVDLYQGKEVLTPAEDILLYKKTMNPMAVSSMDTMEQVQKCILETGFSACEIKDISPNVLKAKNRIYIISLLAYPFAKLGYYLRILTKREHESMILGIYAKRSYQQRLTIYGTVTAKK